MGISYVCVTPNEESGFSIYRGKGCPSNESKKDFAVPA